MDLQQPTTRSRLDLWEDMLEKGRGVLQARSKPKGESSFVVVLEP